MELLFELMEDYEKGQNFAPKGTDNKQENFDNKEKKVNPEISENVENTTQEINNSDRDSEETLKNLDDGKKSIDII